MSEVFINPQLRIMEEQSGSGTKKTWIVEDADSGDPGYYSAFMEVKCPVCGEYQSVEAGQHGWSWGDPFPFVFCPFCGEKLGDKNEK